MGGNYAILTVPGENLILRVQGIRQSLEGTTWTELPKSLTFEENGRTDFALKQIEDLKGENPSLNAIIPSYGGPMKEAKNWTQFVDDNRDLSFVVADAMPNQVQLMERGYADGLVGQLPYQSGELCIDTLLQLQESGNPPKDPNNDLIYGTNLSFLMRIPLELPEVKVHLRSHTGFCLTQFYLTHAFLLDFHKISSLSI
jgi:ABC-type sugar transport system substrate-binding protein